MKKQRLRDILKHRAISDTFIIEVQVGRRTSSKRDIGGSRQRLREKEERWPVSVFCTRMVMAWTKI